jgi:hypothetical protein
MPIPVEKLTEEMLALPADALELKVPRAGAPAVLRPLLPVFSGYTFSRP